MKFLIKKLTINKIIVKEIGSKYIRETPDCERLKERRCKQRFNCKEGYLISKKDTVIRICPKYVEQYPEEEWHPGKLFHLATLSYRELKEENEKTGIIESERVININPTQTRQTSIDLQENLENIVTDSKGFRDRFYRKE